MNAKPKTELNKFVFAQKQNSVNGPKSKTLIGVVTYLFNCTSDWYLNMD